MKETFDEQLVVLDNQFIRKYTGERFVNIVRRFTFFVPFDGLTYLKWASEL